MALLETVHSTVDGPVSGRARKIVAAELREELAATLRLRMVAGLAQATQLAHVTRKLVQVWFVGVRMKEDVCVVFGAWHVEVA